MWFVSGDVIQKDHNHAEDIIACCFSRFPLFHADSFCYKLVFSAQLTREKGLE